MCGRYALGIRAAFVRHQLAAHNMPVDDAPDDDEVRQTYNFAPGNVGLIYRADVPDYGAGSRPHDNEGESEEQAGGDQAPQNEVEPAEKERENQSSPIEGSKSTLYKLQAMKWGLIPFWTKRNPDYGTLMRSINARDDSLAAKGGMWNTMKQKKRCIVIAQGFYEWLKRDGGKTKIPHFTKRKDEQLMCFAGLWDCAQYEGSEEKHYTYSIITTDSNKQLSFLHDRMPVILENGSDQVRTWLDPGRSEWSKELQSLLKPFTGDLECYPVSQEVGKVGNNSPTFIIPVDSTENKRNIANFFSNAKTSTEGEEGKRGVKDQEAKVEGQRDVEHDKQEKRVTVDHSGREDNAPLPVPPTVPLGKGLKRELEDVGEIEPPAKVLKTDADSPARGSPLQMPSKKTRSATTNNTSKGSPMKKDGSQKITSFFK